MSVDSSDTTAAETRPPLSPPVRVPRFLPPHALAMAVVTQIALYFLVGGDPASELLTAGAVVVIAGILLAAAGSRRFAQVGTNIVPFTQSSALVTDGVFAWSRNPMYLGMLLALTGVTIATATPWSLAVVGGFYLFVRWRFIAGEERLMQATFGKAYSAYCARVRRWL